MITIHVESEAEAELVIAALDEALCDEAPALLDLIEAQLPKAQDIVWDRPLGRASRETTAERRRALAGAKGTSYYRRVRPIPKAKADSPYLLWAGNLRDATKKITKKQATSSGISAEVDPKANYKGPIRIGFAAVLARGFTASDLYDVKALADTVSEKIFPNWLEDHVFPNLQRRAAA